MSYSNGVKRLADIVLAALLLPLCLPLAAVVMLSLAFTPSGKIFFAQTRIGRNGRPFTIYKFRTMRPEAPDNVATRELENPDALITPIGRILRRSSLDELPQLWNILRGDMSFVGPRPVVPTETALLRERQRLGADRCRPGLTGLAQVRGRERLEYREKAAYDAAYADAVSLPLDLRILGETLLCVLRQKDIEHRVSPAAREKGVKKDPPHPVEGA